MSARSDVLKALIVHGLQLHPSALSRSEVQRQSAVLDELLEENDPGILVAAIRYGMPNVWPFTEDGGRPYDAFDLRANLLKAKAAVGKLRRSGKLPSYIKTE